MTRARAATVIDIAALLGVTPSAVRKIVARYHIEPTGFRARAKLYDPQEIIRHAGAHKRPLRKGWRKV